jgi:hypothetical protein
MPRITGAALAFLVACGTSTGDQSPDSGHARTVPTNHRAAGSACPSQRGSTMSPCVNEAGVNPPGMCSKDTDCTAGTNGRCESNGPAICLTRCSYDTCSSDSDCPPHVPCDCRASSTDPSPNSCITGSNCRVDSDCGASGYCSPSTTSLCDLAGYFCHTAGDQCGNDTDCGTSDACAFNAQDQKWECTQQCSPPP